MTNKTDKGNTRRISDYFSPKSKVREVIQLGLPHQQYSPSQPAPSLQETPMKPSQVPNLLPKRLPLHSPEMCYRGRPGPPQPPPWGRPEPPEPPQPPPWGRPGPPQPPPWGRPEPPQPPPWGRPGPPQPPPWGRPGPPQPPPWGRPGPPQSPPHPQGPVGSPGPVPSNLNNFNSPARRRHPTPMTPNGFQAIGPASRRGIDQYSPLSSMRRHQLSEPEVPFPTREREYGLTQRLELNEVGCGDDVRSSGPAGQPHRPVPAALTYRSGRESPPSSPVSHSPRWSRGNSQWRPWHSQPSSFAPFPSRSGGPLSPPSPVAARQDHASQEHCGTPSDEKSISGRQKCLSLKRRRIFQDGDTGLKSANTTSCPAQTPNCIPGRAHSPSPSSKTLSCQSHVELSPKTADSQLSTEPVPRLSSGQSSSRSLSPKLSSSPSSYSALSPKLSSSPSSYSALSPKLSSSLSSYSALSPKLSSSPSSYSALSPKLSSSPSSYSALSPKLSSSPSSYSAPSPKLSSSPSCSSLSPRSHSGRRLPGVEPASMKTTRPKEFTSPVKQNGEHFKRETEEEMRRANTSPLDSPARQVFTGQNGGLYMDLKVKDSPCNSPSGYTHRTNPALEVQPLSQADGSGETSGAVRRSKLMSCDVTDGRTPRLTPKPNSGIPHSRTLERSRTAHPRRPVILDDIGDLFTPDTPVSLSLCGLEKLGTKEGHHSPAAHKHCLSSTVAASSSSVLTTSAGSPFSTTPKAKKTLFCHGKETKVSPSVSAHHPKIFCTALVKLKNCLPTNDTGLRKGPVSLVPRFKSENVRMDTKPGSFLTPDSRGICSYKAGTATFKANSTSHHSPATCLGSHEDEDPLDFDLGLSQEQSDEDPLDFDLGLSLELDDDQSSQSSDDEQLLSFQEMMERSVKPPDTPAKGTFSEPRSPVLPSCQNTPQPLPLPSKTKPGVYKNSLAQMLQEMNSSKRSKEMETKLLNSCEENLLKIAEFEEAEENQEEAILPEQQEFIQRYSVVCSAIRDVHPGEPVFNLEHFGRLFNQDTLQLRQCQVNPQETAQKTLLWSSPAQFRSHVSSGLFEEAYSLPSPCPPQVTHFLFKMMSVHRERMISEQILVALKHITDTAAYQIVTSASQQFEVWVPSLADVTQVLMNMGIPFVTLFPVESLQPPFTEGDLLEDIQINSSSPFTKTELSSFPEHNFENSLKYLAYCLEMCPRAYSDNELLLLLTVASGVGLDTQLALRPNEDLRSLQYHVINNIRDWDAMLPRICLALTDLTTDHHNMCWLVQLLPDKTRGRHLRRHLSLSMISKLLNGSCTYRPTDTEFLLSELQPYLPRMKPSTLLRGLQKSSRKQKEEEEEEDFATLDQQAYYLCYSLLSLVNEAATFQLLAPHQKEQLLSLCSVLERHIKCNIRDSAKCLYRSMVKDLVVRIYIKWQMLLRKSRPLQGQLYDFWKPQPEDTASGSQTEEETEEEDGEEEDASSLMEDEEELEREEEMEDIDTAVEELEEEEEEEEQEEACVTTNDSHTNEDNLDEVRMDTATDEDEEEFVEEKDGMKQKVPSEKGDEAEARTSPRLSLDY